MIPPADGLSENEFSLLSLIAKQIDESGRPYLEFTMLNKAAHKSLCEYGVIGIATVTYSYWINTSAPSHSKAKYRVWLTDLGHAYLRGETNVIKECSLDGAWPSSLQICKRHKRKHTQEEVNEARRSIQAN